MEFFLITYVELASYADALWARLEEDCVTSPKSVCEGGYHRTARKS